MKRFGIYSYMYYRLATWYFKFEKKGKISYGASVLVSLSQALIITDILGIIFLNYYNRAERQIIWEKIKPFYIVFILAVAFLNDYRFKNKYDIYREKWKNQSKKEKNLYGFIVFLLIVIPLIFIPIVLNVFDYTQ